MKRSLLVAGLLCVIIFSCTQITEYTNTLLRTDKLPSQLFTIDITKDTVLHTQKGALIRIPKGALSAGTSTVQLEIKEAYTITDILRGGLATQSNGQPLSSGGMIFINPAKDQDAKIVQPVQVSIPTAFVENNMQLFKGEEQKDGSINWTDPQPMLPSPQTAMLERGKELFLNNCATCHNPRKDMTGPSLEHILERVPQGVKGYDDKLKLLYAFTRNNGKILKEGVPYYCCLYRNWNKTPMNLFPSLSDADLDALYGYIENESLRSGIPHPTPGKDTCAENCKQYVQLKGDLIRKKNKLQSQSVPMVIENRLMIDSVTLLMSSDTVTSIVEKVSSATRQSFYYQFTITSFGWYNVDMLSKDIPGSEKSKLVVYLAGQYAGKTTIYLIVPSVNVLAPAGKLSSGDGFGFYDLDGGIFLPQGIPAYIVVIGEYDDNIVFAKQAFTTSRNQDFTLEPEIVTQDVFETAIKSLNLNNINFSVNETAIAPDLRKTIKDLKDIEKLKPANCDCDCYLPFDIDLITDSSSRRSY
ncbi:MAG: cytochrome c [Chitinophagaceae bacterium]